jgi:hypothetical protein
MSDAQLYRDWGLWLIVGGALVAAAAVLLIWILVLARAIAANATRALRAAEKIRANTQPIWALAATNATAAQLLEAAWSIEDHAGQVADLLEGHGQGAVSA